MFIRRQARSADIVKPQSFCAEECGGAGENRATPTDDSSRAVGEAAEGLLDVADVPLQPHGGGQGPQFGCDQRDAVGVGVGKRVEECLLDEEEENGAPCEDVEMGHPEQRGGAEGDGGKAACGEEALPGEVGDGEEERDQEEVLRARAIPEVVHGAGRGEVRVEKAIVQALFWVDHEIGKPVGEQKDEIKPKGFC